MNTDDPEAIDVLRRAMVARIATLSRTGRPSIAPLYFVLRSGRIWLGTSTWTLAARNIQTSPQVSILFAADQDRAPHRVLRMIGRASLQTARKVQRAYTLRVAWKYLLTPGGIRDTLAHWRQLPFRRRYHAQSAAKGPSCLIEVILEHAEFLVAEPFG